MSNLLRAFWLASLLFFVSGCSGVGQTRSVRDKPEDPYHDIVNGLDNGELVWLTMDDGSILSGRVVGRTLNFLTIEDVEAPFERQDVQARRIYVVETESRRLGTTTDRAAVPGEGSSMNSTLAVVLGLVFMGAIVAAVVVASRIDVSIGNSAH